MRNSEDSAAFVIFNVKGRDLMAVDRPNESLTDSDRSKYEALGLSASPFVNVKYYIPYYQNRPSTYLPKEDIDDYISCGQLLKYKYCYDSDKGSLEMMFADVDDPTQSMEAILSRITDDHMEQF